MPFSVTVPKAERDLKLSDKLKSEWPGILQWMIGGAIAWQTQGLNPPPIVTSATDKYFLEEDVLGQWILDRCVTGKKHWEPVDTLFHDWNQWNQWPDPAKGWSKKRFSQALEAKGFLRDEKGHKKTKCFGGIALKNASSQGVHPSGGVPPTETTDFNL